jgi:hypothetical protein
MELQDLEKPQAERDEVGHRRTFLFTWKAFFVAMFLWWVSGSLGIGMAITGC